MTEPTIWERMATILEQVAPIVTEGPGDGAPVLRFDVSHSRAEGMAIESMLGSALPAQWIAESTGSYLAEGAGGIRTLGILLRNNSMTGSFEAVVRAIFERTGRINWVLEESPELGPRRHALSERALKHWSQVSTIGSAPT